MKLFISNAVKDKFNTSLLYEELAKAQCPLGGGSLSDASGRRLCLENSLKAEPFLNAKFQTGWFVISRKKGWSKTVVM